MKFMLLGREAKAQWEGIEPAEKRRRRARHVQAVQDLVAQRLAGGSGLVLISAELSPDAAATTLRVAGGSARVVEPAQVGEVLTSIDVVDFDSHRQAVDFAKSTFDQVGQRSEIRAVHETWFAYHGAARGDEPKFAVFFLNDERAIAALSPAEIERSVRRHEEVGWQYNAEKGLARGETFSFAGVRLRPSAEGTMHRVEDGGHVTSDGPFVEIKELVGGLQLFDCASRQEAVEWAKKLAVRDGDGMEVRAIESLWWIYHG